ncbi:uncharacterized protein B0I36DRAFT_356555 [Microdochium trichocladiopsis]|uniref:Uncharacterized protein n=1 Tax=Microdochium trichocladiopsis TaxID=1682393 RepID=A0A9P8XPW9_9PEZI|nr:uncharacterized protein B0I36DRAFT_356555 [Microdochium trichocladiopsis]KAH7010644.1 hypothetical protein B0I36DRAFT_356555 [Microdochium trichocladiopsis]
MSNCVPRKLLHRYVADTAELFVEAPCYCWVSQVEIVVHLSYERLLSLSWSLVFLAELSDIDAAIRPNLYPPPLLVPDVWDAPLTCGLPAKAFNSLSPTDYVGQACLSCDRTVPDETDQTTGALVIPWLDGDDWILFHVDKDTGAAYMFDRTPRREPSRVVAFFRQAYTDAGYGSITAMWRVPAGTRTDKWSSGWWVVEKVLMLVTSKTSSLLASPQ